MPVQKTTRRKPASGTGRQAWEPRFFQSAEAFRAWLTEHGQNTAELWVGFYKKDSGRGGLTYQEGVAEALCFGWIDGLKKRVDALSYTHRFTPRQARSTWSLVNVRLAEKLLAAGRMAPPGLRVFETRDPARSGQYSYESRPSEFSPEDAATFQADPAAWKFFTEQPPGYQRTAVWWVLSAKQEATRARRLAQLMADSRAGRRLGLVTGQAATSL